MIGAYWFCVTLGVAWTLVSVVLGHIGNGAPAEDAPKDTGLPLLSPPALATFVASFGALGLVGATLFGTERTSLHLPVALVGAGALAVLVALRLAREARAVESDPDA